MKKLIILFLFLSGTLFSQNFIREYTYNASENDSKSDARKYALLEIKKQLAEELGSYIITSTNLSIKEKNKINDIMLSTQSQTISECITQTKILAESWNGELFYIKVKIHVDKQDFIRRLKDISEKTTINTNLDNVEVTFDEEKTTIGFYLSMDICYQQLSDVNLKDNQSLTVGVRLGVILNENIVLGIWGFANTENLYNEYVDSYLGYGGGGIFLEPRILPRSFIHVNLPIKAGFGTVSYADNNWNLGTEEDLSKDSYFIVEPGAELVFDVVRYFKISVGTSYRFTDDIVLKNTPTNVLSGWIFNLSLKIVY
jgi:hypothetical protein